MRYAVFTAIFGDGFRLHEPKVRSPHCDYLCFTDQPLESEIWDVRYRDYGPRTRTAARRVKILQREMRDYDATLWIDSRFQLLVDPVELFEMEADFAALKHPDRSNLDDEAKAIIARNKAPGTTTIQQLERYVGFGFGPELPAITTTGFLMRRNTQAVHDMAHDWWTEVMAYTLRDQMSIDYCLHKHAIPVYYLPGHYRANKYARWIPDA